ncbi:MAG: hypothetical protein ACMUJM_07385 [bacterium]
MATILLTLFLSVVVNVMILYVFFNLFVKPLVQKEFIFFEKMLQQDIERQLAPFKGIQHMPENDTKAPLTYSALTSQATHKPRDQQPFEKSFHNKEPVSFQRTTMDTASTCEPRAEKTETSPPLNFRFNASLSSNERLNTSQQQPYNEEVEVFKKSPEQEFKNIKVPHDKLEAFQHIYECINSALSAVREIIMFIESDTPSKYQDKRGFIKKLELNILNIIKYQISNSIHFNQQNNRKIKDILYSLKTFRQQLVIYQNHNMQNISQETKNNWGNLEYDIIKDIKLLKEYFQEELKDSPDVSK